MQRILTLTLAVWAISLNAQDDGFLSDFQKKWHNAMEYTMEFAEAMPADKYDFRPTDVQMPFHRQLTHVAGNMVWITTAFLGGSGYESLHEEAPETKEQVIEHLREAFTYTARVVAGFEEDELSETVDFFAGPLTKRQMFFLLTDHVTHHRGQLVVYLRMNDIVPPRYRGW